MLLKHQKRKDYKFVVGKNTIEDSNIIDMPPISKPIKNMKKLDVWKCSTIYLQKIGYGIGGLKKYGNNPTPLWWPTTQDWNVDWTTWQGPSRTKVADNKTLLVSMMTFFKCKFVNDESDSEDD